MKINFILLIIFLFVSSINLTPVNNVVLAQKNTPTAPVVVEVFKPDLVDSSLHFDCKSISPQACIEKKISNGFILLDIQLTYRNISNKIINAVSWEVKTSEENKEPILLQFKISKRVDPNKLKIINLTSTYQNHFREYKNWAMSLTKVEFTDGTFWENTSKDESNFLSIPFAPDLCNVIIMYPEKPEQIMCKH